MTSPRPLLTLACALAASSCASSVQPPQPTYVRFEMDDRGPRAVDLLVMVENSNAMRDDQSHLLASLGPLLASLTNPPCTSNANPAPHACDPSNAGDQPIAPPVASLHFGVVSSDLGTPGSSVPGCVDSDHGDDGVLNPIRNGPSLLQHEPWTADPPTYGRPTDCSDPNEYPSFISFDSGTTDASQFVHDMRCNAGIYVHGCGLVSPLESAYHALVIHDASDHAGNTDVNAGFLRDDAVLAILMLDNKEDGSVRNCMYAQPGSPCTDALDAYNAASTAWASSNLRLRFLMYQPGGPQDPTWNLDRYVNPRVPTAGLLSLKPNHPETIVFAAIAGMPLDGWRNADGSTNWNALLGTPSASPDDFAHRDSRTAINTMSPEGPISMWQANLDPMCPERVVPACRREGTAYNPPACTTDQQYFAYPARRIIEVARRFDEDPLCGGQPCHNGIVGSVCHYDDTEVMTAFARTIQSRVSRCYRGPLPTTTDANGDVTLRCRIVETIPNAQLPCDAQHGLLDPIGTGGARVPAPTVIGGGPARFCELRQLSVDPSTQRPVDANAHGWYFDGSRASANCTFGGITYTPGDQPAPGTQTTFECVAVHH